MARRTSIDVYHRIESEGLLSKRRWQVYSILFKHGPLTKNEINQRITTDFVNSNNVSSRLTELREMGCVCELGTRICSLSKNTVILWDVTDSMPRQFDRSKIKKSRKELEARMTVYREVLVELWKDKRTPSWVREVIRERTKQFRKEKRT